MSETLMVGMAEMKFASSSDDILVALGLGSCIGICAYDAQSKVAGLAHVVLPETVGHETNPGKFADTAVPMLLSEMQKRGASLKTIRVALVGGAQLFAFNGAGPRLEIGLRNAAAVQAALQKQNIPVVVSDLGGNSGRTVQMTAGGGVRVKTIGQGEQELVHLGEPERANAARSPLPTAASRPEARSASRPAYAPLGTPGANPVRSRGD